MTPRTQQARNLVKYPWLARTKALPPIKLTGPHTAPTRNNTSGIPGVAARYQKVASGLNLYLHAKWGRGNGYPGGGAISRSAERHGVLEAVRQVLEAREKGCGQPLGYSPRGAWKILKKSIESNCEG